MEEVEDGAFGMVKGYMAGRRGQKPGLRIGNGLAFTARMSES